MNGAGDLDAKVARLRELPGIGEVTERVILELKSVDTMAPIHEAQMLTYLRLTRCPVGLLINFNVQTLKDGISSNHQSAGLNQGCVRPRAARTPARVLLRASPFDSGSPC